MKRRRIRPKPINHHVLLKALTRAAHRRQGGVCYHCGIPITLRRTTADHYPVAKYQGGMTKAGNIVAACAECNNTRNRETDRHGGRLNTTVGDPTPHSPFEVLKARRQE